MLNTQWGLMVWTLITFRIAVYILWRSPSARIQRALDQRRQSVQDSMDAAEQARAEAHRLLDEYKETLAKVRAEAEEILERSRTHGRARQGRADRPRRAPSRTACWRRRTTRSSATRAPRCASSRAQIAELTALATEKVAAGSLSASDQERLIDEALAELKVDQLGMENQG